VAVLLLIESLKDDQIFDENEVNRLNEVINTNLESSKI